MGTKQKVKSPYTNPYSGHSAGATSRGILTPCVEHAATVANLVILSRPRIGCADQPGCRHWTCREGNGRPSAVHQFSAVLLSATTIKKSVRITL
jgi:hypothetical protein